MIRVRTLTLMLVAVLGAAGAFLLPARSADASGDWCWDDPVVRINGQQVSVINGLQGTPDQVRQAVRTAEVVFYVPRGVDVDVVSMTRRYFVETVRVVKVDIPWRAGQPVPVVISTTFNMHRGAPELPAAMQVLHPGGSLMVTGTTGAPIVAAAMLDPRHAGQSVAVALDAKWNPLLGGLAGR